MKEDKVKYVSKGKTIISDIDGTLLKHERNTSRLMKHKPKLLPGVKKKFNQWHSLGYRIILMTGRPESIRQLTEEQLRSCGLFWDTLIMGVGSGPRVLLNDLKPSFNEPMAVAINLQRDQGLGDVDV